MNTRSLGFILIIGLLTGCKIETNMNLSSEFIEKTVRVSDISSVAIQSDKFFFSARGVPRENFKVNFSKEENYAVEYKLYASEQRYIDNFEKSIDFGRKRKNYYFSFDSASIESTPNQRIQRCSKSVTKKNGEVEIRGISGLCLQSISFTVPLGFSSTIFLNNERIYGEDRIDGQDFLEIISKMFLDSDKVEFIEKNLSSKSPEGLNEDVMTQILKSLTFPGARLEALQVMADNGYIEDTGVRFARDVSRLFSMPSDKQKALEIIVQ